MRLTTTALILTFAGSLGTACSGGGPATNANAANTQVQNTAQEPAKPTATPSSNFTEADVAKLKWLEGTWRGTGLEKPFYQRFRVEGSKLIIDTYGDATLSKVIHTTTFELKNGEFGHTAEDRRTAASSITETSASFVPDNFPMEDGGESPDRRGDTYTFERRDDGTWVTHHFIPKTKKDPGGERIIKMEPWKATAASARPANSHTNAQK